MPLIDDAGRRVLTPRPGATPASTGRKPSDLEQEKTPGTEPWKMQQPEFIARQRRIDMLARNQWMPQTQPDNTWSKMPQDERDKLKLLPSYTYEMTPFETDRLRRLPGSDMPQASEGAVFRTGTGDDPYFIEDSDNNVERVSEPTYSRALTWEQYDKLSDAERAVVDFNGDFLEARARDFENKEVYKKTATPEQRDKYNADVASIFGGRGGSETYAPSVVSLLKSVDFDAVGQDLDEYLNLDRLIDADEIALLKGTAAPVDFGDFESHVTNERFLDAGEYDKIRAPENLAALDRVLAEKYAAQITKVMQDGYLRLKDVQSSMESARSTQTLSYGGVGFNDAVTPGFPVVITPGSEEATKQPETLSTEQQMGLLRRGVYEYAINKDNTDSAPMFQWLAENKLTKDEQSSLWEYVRERLRQDKEWGVPDMVQQNVPKRRTYDETEKFLGMEG